MMKDDFLQRISQQKTPEKAFFLNEYCNKMAEKIK